MAGFSESDIKLIQTASLWKTWSLTERTWMLPKAAAEQKPLKSLQNSLFLFFSASFINE